MKHFTKADICLGTNDYLKRISCDISELISNPLWFHKRNLMQTASGYGKALKSEFMIHYEGRKYRVLYTLFSNSGTYYFKTKNFDVILNIY